MQVWHHGLMGYIEHRVVIVTVSGYINDREHAPRSKVEAFRASLPEEWQRLVIGPVPAVINGYDHYIFLPDGSKEGWEASDRGDEYRRQFEEIFAFRYEDGSSPFDMAEVTYGGDFEMEFGGPRAADPREQPERAKRAL